MKIDHSIMFPQIIEKGNNKLIIKADGVENYLPQDFNNILALALLKSASVLSDKTKTEYEQQLNITLDKLVNLPNITYSGKLADIYTQLSLEGYKLMDDPEYMVNLNALFNSIHFDGDMPGNLPDVSETRATHIDVMLKTNEIINKIRTEINADIIITSGWERKPNGDFDFKLPAKLVLEVANYDSVEVDKLKALCDKVVKKFTFNKDETDIEFPEWIFEIEFNNQ